MSYQILCMQNFCKAYAASFSKPTEIDFFFLQDTEQGSFNSVFSSFFFSFHVM